MFSVYNFEIIIKQFLWEGSYAAVDVRTVPQEVQSNLISQKSLKPISKPANYVSQSAKPQIAIPTFGGVTVLPNINTFPRPSKPIILYEYEASKDCQRVREACSMLDLTVDFRPCPGGTSGWSDTQSTATLGQRSVPFMVDNNPSMIK